MGIILGGLGLFVAFCGLWLASFALKKIDSQIDEFLKGPVQRLRESITKVEDRVSTTQNEVEGFKKQTKDAIQALGKEMEQLKNAAAQLNKALTETNDKITALQQQMPQRRPGQPAPRPAAPQAAPQPAPKPKSTAGAG